MYLVATSARAGAFDEACAFLEKALEERLLPDDLTGPAREYLDAHRTRQDGK